MINVVGGGLEHLFIIVLPCHTGIVACEGVGLVIELVYG